MTTSLSVSASASCTSILRIGGPLTASSENEIAVDIIRKQLLHHFQQSQQELQQPTETTSKIKKDMLYFSNKYFEALVNLKSIDYKHDDNLNKSNEKEDGVILIFPNDASIETFANTHDQAISNVESLGDTLRLCLTIKTSTESMIKANLTKKEKEEQYSQRILWCLDHGYEYIEVDISQEGLTTGFDEREKDGFARVIEAISGTVWSSAIMMTRNTRNATSTATATSINDDGNNVDTAAGDEDDGLKNKINHDENMDEQKEKQQHELNTEEAQISINKNGTKNNSDSNDDETNEAVLNDIEKVMNEAKKIREASKHGQLSDDERRQRAGDAAEMLMGLLDQIGFDDDDDDYDDDGD